MENDEILEGKKTDNLEATSASVPTDVETGKSEDASIPDLSNSTVPTQEEVEDANLSVAPEETAPSAETPVVETPVVETPAPESDQPVVGENVQSVPGETAPAVSQEPLVHEENGVTDSPALEKSFTQSQVNEMMGNTRIETRDKTFRYIYDRYGVQDEAGLDELVGNAQRYDSLHEQYEGDKKAWKQDSDASAQKLADLSEQVALMQSGIDDSRYEDAKFILKGKGLEVSLDNIRTELATHPEWKKGGSAEEANPNFVKTEEPVVNPQPAEPDTKISVLGNDNSQNDTIDSEEDYAMKRLLKV